MANKQSIRPEKDNNGALSFMFRAFSYRNYRLFFCGQGISLVGTWIQQIALSWLAYRLTGSAFLLGLVVFAGQVPVFALTLFFGVLSDRWERKRILIITQSLAMLQAFLLAFLVMKGQIAVWHIIALSVFLGLVNSLDIPVRHAFIYELIDKKEDLGNAIALSSSMFNVTRLIGPSIAGVLVSLVGEGLCFFINGISFLGVILALFSMKMVSGSKESKGQSVLEGLKETYVYFFSFSPIRAILLLLAFVSLMGSSYMVLMPIFAAKILRGGPQTLGFLMTAAGTGALAATMYLTARKSILGLGRTIAFSCCLFGVSLIIFSLSRALWFSLLILVFGGFGMMAQATASNTVLQTIVDDDKRGRLMSPYVMSFMGMVPFGSLLSGYLASRIGVANTLMICGGFCVLGSLIFAGLLPALRPKLRPVYVKKGIIPETQEGVQWQL